MDQDSAALTIDIEPTKEACVGAATAYLMRRIAARAGCYAPGIQERWFNDLERNGRNLNIVDRWFGTYQNQLSQMGYRFLARRVAFQTSGILSWIESGDGFRGAVLPTVPERLHPDMEINRKALGSHAVAVTVNAPNGNGQPIKGLNMVDPLPGVGITQVPNTLESARREKKFAAFLLYWSGYS